jgi:two-component system response regulator YesN
MVLEAVNLKSVARQNGSERERERIRFAVGNVLEYSLLEEAEHAGKYILIRSQQEDKLIVFFSVGSSLSAVFANWMREFKASMTDRMKSYVKESVTIVFTSEGTLESLPDIYEEALRKLTQTKIYGDVDSDGDMDQEALHAFRDVELLMEPKALADLLKHGDEHDVREAMTLFPAMVREWGVDLLRDLHHRVFEWLLDVFEEARKAGWKREYWKRRPLQVWEKIEAFDTSEALQSFVLVYLLQANTELQGISRNQILQKAKAYIQEHFAEPITVQTVADHVFLSPEWLSTLFKKNAGMTFLDYVTHLRMEKAKALLQDVSLKIYQISSEVGYRDTVYFSKLFRKKFGCTPKEYRNQEGIFGDE